MFNVQAAVAAAAEVGPNMNEATAGGGGDYTPPAEGAVRLRLVGYIETGKVTDKQYNKVKEKVSLLFELSGPKHPPREFDGKKVPDLIVVNQTLSLNQKSGFYKLFKRMNYTGKHTHMAQMLGEAFMGTIHHNTVGEGDQKRVYANLHGPDGVSTIRPPFFETMDEEGNMVSKPVPVDEALSPLRCFIWNAPVQLKEMWDSLFIDGKTEDRKDEKTGEVIAGKSKNFWQNKIKAAENFAGSPIAELLFAGGEPDLGEHGASKPERTEANVQASADAKAGAAADPLAGI